jgi:RNA polymerase sigma-70 factor (sigma-E family)
MGHASVPGPAAGAPATGWAGAVTDSIPPPGVSLDVSAIAALFRDHHAELVRLALLMVGDMATAEDVVQDVYASLYRGSRTRRVEAPLPYVRAAVLNGCRSVLRRRAIAHRVGLAHRASLNDETTVRASAESEVILSEDRRQVLSALARLPRRRREVLVLRYYLGLSEAEIAAVLGISAGTVKSTAARALAALARDLGEPS